MTPAAILAENATRAAARRAAWDDYDPLTGVGCFGERVPLVWFDGAEPVFIPASMLDDPDLGRLLSWCVRYGASVESAFRLDGEPLTDEHQDHVNRLRIRHDYEFWCATCVTVEDFKTGARIPFVLRPLQRVNHARRERDRLSGGPVRHVEVKGRRYGSTTDKRTYVWWLQNLVYPGRHAFLISLDKTGGAAEIARGYEAVAEHHPAWAGTYETEGVRGSNTTRRIRETGSLYGVASVNNPQGASGFAAHFALFSEMGKMPSNEVQSARALVTNVTSVLPQAPGTYAAMESTAERAGAVFREYVRKAARGEGGWSFVFSCWTDDPNCWQPLAESRHVTRAGGPEAWVASWTAEKGEVAERLRLLWAEGHALEQIAFFETVAREKPAFEDALQEYPLTWQEAFQTGDRRRFAPKLVGAARRTTREPIRRGRLVADGTTGKAALKNIRFEDDPRGPLSLWREPGEVYGLIRPGYEYRDGFASAMDIGGTWKGADFTVVGVLDRRPAAHGLPPEIVAEWHGHMDQDLAAWEAARLSAWYGDALLAVEVNSLKEDEDEDGGDGDHSLTVLDRIRRVYPNLYRRRVLDQRTREIVEKLGWITNRATKTRALDLLGVWLREADEDGGGYVEACAAACDEMDSYLVDDRGRVSAAEGSKDDRVMTRAILAAVHEEMPAPVMIDPALAARDAASASRVGLALAGVSA